MRLRDIAAALGITERTAYAIVRDLVVAGYIVKNKEGRRNRYEIRGDLPLGESIAREQTIGEVLAVLVGGDGTHGGSDSTRASPLPRQRH